MAQHHTPISKQKSAFKSPAPSNKKAQQMMKSPIITTQRQLFQYQGTGLPSSDKWAVSPVCSRLKDHISMLGGGAQKERLFLQSPMPNQNTWLLASPAIEPARFANFHSTAPNTTTGSKYNHNATQESYSEMKTFHFVQESPRLIKKFGDQPEQVHYNNHQGFFNSTLKSTDKSDFKNNQPSNNNWQSIKDLVPATMGIEPLNTEAQPIQISRLDLNKQAQIPIQQIQDSNVYEMEEQNQQSDQQQKSIENSQFQKPAIIQLQHPTSTSNEAQNQSQKVQINPYYEEQEYDQNDEESMRSEEMDGDSSNAQSNKGTGKGGHSRSYVMNSNGEYERIIRKRKRKSTDQIKILMREFDRNPNWSKETLLEVSRKTGLSEAQVYKWGWDQKRKKYGPELAAQMMPPFGQFSDQDVNFHSEYNIQFENEGNTHAQNAHQRQGRNSSNFPNPTPFPDSNLLDQLSNKLALEESYVHNQYLMNQESKKNSDSLSFQDDTHNHDHKYSKNPRKSNKSNLEQPKLKKNASKGAADREQSVHDKNLKQSGHNKKQLSQAEELISISLSQENSNKRTSKVKDKGEAKQVKLEKRGDHNKENLKPLVVHISDNDRKTRSGVASVSTGKDNQKLNNKKDEDGQSLDSRKLREQRVLRKHNLNK